METANDCFVEALQKKMKEQGRGAKKQLAATVGVSPNHLSDILAKRKNAGQKLKERIAEALELSFEGMLGLGRHIVEQQAAESGNEKKRRQGSAVSAGEHPPQHGKTLDYMAMAAKILESRTPFRQALMGNITQYYESMGTALREKKALQMIEDLQKEITIMRQDIKTLKQPDEKNSTDSRAA